jgi:D-aspartate ligase
VPIARTLHRRGVRVSALVTPQHSWVARSRWIDGHVVPLLPEGLQRWLALLEDFARAGEGVLISGTDRATEFLVRERARIPGNLKSFESADSAHLELMNKDSLYALAAQVGIRCPWTLRLSSRSELEAVMDQARYPCLLKPAVSHRWRRLFGDRRVIVIRGPQDLPQVAGPALDARLELLVTEYIPGPDENLEATVLLRQADGSFPLSYGRRKIRQYPAGFGGGSLIESAPVPETTAAAIRLLEAARFVGLAGVELKWHAETGELFLIEVNVRLVATFGLGDASNTDASWRLYATLAGLPLGPQPAQRAGVRSVTARLEPRAVVDALRQRTTSPRALLASYRGVRTISGLSLRDPAPVLALGLQEIRRVGRHLRYRLGAEPPRAGHR